MLSDFAKVSNLGVLEYGGRVIGFLKTSSSRHGTRTAKPVSSLNVCLEQSSTRKVNRVSNFRARLEVSSKRISARKSCTVKKILSCVKDKF